MVLRNETKSKLGYINWDFDKRLYINNIAITPFNNRKYHSYPGTFIPEIPFSLVELLSKEGEVVMDPFGGIGTTFTQALIQKRIPISIDNNPIATQITKDFYTLFKPNVQIEIILKMIKQITDNYDLKRDYTIGLSGKHKELVEWYEYNTLNQVAFLIKGYDELRSSKVSTGVFELYHLCLSNLLTTVCSQNGGWAYIADNVKPKKECLHDKRALDRFLANMSVCAKGIQSYKDLLKNSLSYIYEDKQFEKIICEDFSNMNVNSIREKVDLVITSPPYPRMIDYVKSQRLSFYLDQEDFQAKIKTEIGARARRNQTGEIDLYVKSMKNCNSNIISSLKRGGYLCYILPDFSSEEKRDRMEAIDEVIRDCTYKGLDEVYRITRCIPGTQRSNNIKWASLKKENIIILEKK